MFTLLRRREVRLLREPPISVFFLLCLLSCSDSTEQSAKSGDDVTLRCQGPRDKNITVIAWTRPDLKAKTGRYVFFYRNNRPYDKYQHESFHSRVHLKDPQIKDGDVSVILKNVTINDTGTYECRVSGSSIDPPLNTIHLTVTDSGETSGQSGTGGDEDGGKEERNVGLPVVLLLVLVAAGGVGFLFYKKYIRCPDLSGIYRAAPQQV